MAACFDAAIDGAELKGRRESAGLSDQIARGKNRSEEHTSELQSRPHLVCRLLLEKKKYSAAALTLTDLAFGKVNVISCSTHWGKPSLRNRVGGLQNSQYLGPHGTLAVWSQAVNYI